MLTYGVIGGIGVGLCYIAPIQVATRWFPDKKGLATGLTVAGFGGSPFVSTYIGQELIKMDNHVSDALLYMGIAFLVIIIVAFWFMRFPEAGWKPAGWTPKATTCGCHQRRQLQPQRDHQDPDLLVPVRLLRHWLPGWPDGHRRLRQCYG